ncbi:MAG: hypothetical protein M3Z85_04570 [Acidobacteriota bacterium]|nr:hypothetical protein [Acidobacteriota bacterium]
MLTGLQNNRYKKWAGGAMVAAFAGIPPAALADTIFADFIPGNLVVSRSVYAGTAASVKVGQKLPPSCPSTALCNAHGATNDGSYPGVWNNVIYDGSFTITAPIFLDQITPDGTRINTLSVPVDLVVTSFASKSELALNLSPKGDVVTFMGYVAPVNALDASNSNTPGIIDPTNPVGDAYYRGVVQVYASGAMELTITNAYSGNNGRAAIQANGYLYMVGNAGNGTATRADVYRSTGLQIALPGQPSMPPTEVGNFSVANVTDPATGMPYPADKPGKDNNFRGLTLFRNNLYIAKGTGNNGINTVYQVGDPHVMPTLGDAATQPITILPGFSTTPVKAGGTGNPFGLWFGDAATLYVSDEGDGTVRNAETSQTAGLQKWILVNGKWQFAYVMQNGLNLGQPYTVPDYPVALSPFTDGLRNITGRNNGDGTVTIWAVTSTISGSGDQGADPNKLVAITDVLSNADPSLASLEPFTTIMSAGFGEVLRGVSFTPGTVKQKRGRK